MTHAIPMIDRPCPLCGSTDVSRVFAEAKFDSQQLDKFSYASRKIPEYMHHRLIMCSVCDLVYSSPVPAPDSLVRAYDEAAFDSSEESHCASRTYGRFLPHIKKRLRDLVGAIDVGTGDGAFLGQLLAEGFTDVVGIEPSKAPIEVSSRDVRSLIRYGPFDAQHLESGGYSLVTCFQTLEHLYDPLGMCQSAFELLKEDGAAFFICHNRRAVSTKLLGTRSPIFDIEHLQLFSPTSVKYLLEQGGFYDVEVQSVWNTYPLHYWFKLFPFPITLKRRVIAALKKTGIGYLPCSVPAGNLAAVGYKRKGKGA